MLHTGRLYTLVAANRSNHRHRHPNRGHFQNQLHRRRLALGLF